MEKRHKILAVIPARGGSKGIPGKNVKPLGGKPLITYSIEAAQKSRFIDRIVVSTDDTEIAFVAKEHKAEVIERPVELALDATPMEPVLTHAVRSLLDKGYVPDAVVLLQPTSPLRTEAHIDSAVEKFLSGDFDSLVSIFTIKNNRHEINKDGFLTPTFTKSKNRSERPAAVFENGAIYVSRADVIRKGKIRGDKMGYYEMGRYSSIDIDELIDFAVAEQLLSIRGKTNL